MAYAGTILLHIPPILNFGIKFAWVVDYVPGRFTAPPLLTYPMNTRQGGRQSQYVRFVKQISRPIRNSNPGLPSPYSDRSTMLSRLPFSTETVHTVHWWRNHVTTPSSRLLFWTSTIHTRHPYLPRGSHYKSATQEVASNTVDIFSKRACSLHTLLVRIGNESHSTPRSWFSTPNKSREIRLQKHTSATKVHIKNYLLLGNYPASG